MTGPWRAPRAIPARVSLAVAVTALACAGPVKAQTQAAWLFADVSFPAQVDTFLAVGAERWPEPERGAVLHYESERAPGATFDVHVQPLPEAGNSVVAVREELQRTLEELRRYSAGGGARTTVAVDTVHAVSVEAGGTTYEGHVVEATLRVGTTVGHTLAFVFAKPPSFVKFRVTYEPGRSDALDLRIQPFLSGVLERLESFQDPLPTGGP